MKILIVDDESLARKRILKILEEESNDYSVNEASSGKEAISLINKINPDIVFLDIQMTDLTGFDVIKKIEKSMMPIIIFVTAFDNFAIKAFEVEAVDFLLKPYKKDRLLASLKRAILRIKSNESKLYEEKIHRILESFKKTSSNSEFEKKNYLEKIVLKVGRKFLFADVEKIKYITSSAYYAEIFMQDGKKHVYRTSMTALMQKLNPKMFLRVNRSTIVKILEINEVISEGLGDYSLIMKDQNKFNVTKNYKNSFLNTLGIKS